ncbi:MAG: hypothetical protein IH614_20410 [Desulfuromonadales bacterium]|nr:hypothetical protein [Desulfuromonadales bacterium]
MNRKKVIPFVLAWLVVAAPAGALAQAQPGGGQMASGSGEMPEACRQMLEQRTAMKKEMAEMDAKLQESTQKMNAAQGDQKVEAIAVVVNQLVDQHRAMHERMQAMGPMMMHHMAGHMKQGTMECPMMEQMPMHPATSPDKGTGGGAGHEEHHPK